MSKKFFEEFHISFGNDTISNIFRLPVNRVDNLYRTMRIFV